MHAARVKIVGLWTVGVLVFALLPFETATADSPAPDPTSAVAPSPEATDAADPATDPSPTPDPAVAATPSPEPTAEPTPTPTPTSSLPKPLPTMSPLPSPTAAPDDEHEHEHDGPTMPLTRELPARPMAPTARLAASWGPQPVFRFPYAPGARWGVSGSHADSDGINRGAIDFAPLSSSTRAVRAVAAGQVYRVSCAKGWFLGVDHGGGWMSEYYHLSGAKSSLIGKWVEAGTVLGNAGQTLPCGGTPGASAHVHLSILNEAIDVPSGKRKYIPVTGVQFDNYTIRDTSGYYNGTWRNLAGKTVLTSRGVTCCLRASTRVGPSAVSSSLPDLDSDGIDDYSEAAAWNTDVNGDGRPDIVAFGSAGVYTARSTGSTFSAETLTVRDFGTAKGWQRSKNPRIVVDVNGDGRSDIVGFGNSGVYVSTSTGTSFSASRKWVTGFGASQGWKVGRHLRTVADVTGDGRPDIVGINDTGVYVARNTGSGFASPALWGKVMSSSSGWSSSRHPRMVIDVTGDGLADLVGFGNGGVYVARNTGSGFASLSLKVRSFGYGQGWGVKMQPRYVTDVNDDGRPDVVGFGNNGVSVSLNTGSGFAAAKLWTTSFRSGTSAGRWRGDRHGRLLADVNGDGRPDIVGFGTAATYVSLNRGSSFASSTRWTTNFGATEWTRGWMPRGVADVNGDGRADVVGFARDGVHVALSSGSRFGAAAHWSRSFGYDTTRGTYRVASHPRAIVG